MDGAILLTIIDKEKILDLLPPRMYMTRKLELEAQLRFQSKHFDNGKWVSQTSILTAVPNAHPQDQLVILHSRKHT